MDIEESIYMLNPHWEENFFYNFPRQRFLVKKLKKLLKEPIIKALTGPRRVGKTVMLKQLINHLINTGVSRKDILYYSFEAKERVWDVIKGYLSIRGKQIGAGSIYLFLDEIQYAPDWEEELKKIYDTWEKNVNIFISGSSSLKLEKGRALLTGRFYSIEVGALSFSEYMALSGRTVKNELEFNMFLRRQLPYLAVNKDADPYAYIKEVVKKALYEDSTLTGIREPYLLDSIFKSVISIPGQIVKIENLSNDFQVSRNTMRKYLFALQQLNLVRKLYNFRGSIRKTEVKAKKYYPFYTALSFYTSKADEGHLYESYVAEVLKPSFFWRKSSKEIDFYFPEKETGVEVKAKKRVLKRELSTLCSSKLKMKRRILISKPNAVVESPCNVENFSILDVDAVKL